MEPWCGYVAPFTCVAAGLRGSRNPRFSYAWPLNHLAGYPPRVMLFASTELAARIERAEVRLLDDSAAAIARRRAEAEVLRVPLAGGMASWPGSASGARSTWTSWTRSSASLRERDTPLQAEVATLAEPAVGATLAKRGYVLQGFENVLGRALSRAEGFPEATEVVVVPGKEDDFDEWLDAVATGFAHPDDQGVVSHECFPRDVLERVMRDMASGDGFQRWLAYRAGTLAGGASPRLTDGVAQLCGAATLPEHRRRGVQTALLHARLTEVVVDLVPGETREVRLDP